MTSTWVSINEQFVGNEASLQNELVQSQLPTHGSNGPASDGSSMQMNAGEDSNSNVLRQLGSRPHSTGAISDVPFMKDLNLREPSVEPQQLAPHQQSRKRAADPDQSYQTQPQDGDSETKGIRQVKIHTRPLRGTDATFDRGQVQPGHLFNLDNDAPIDKPYSAPRHFRHHKSGTIHTTRYYDPRTHIFRSKKPSEQRPGGHIPSYEWHMPHIPSPIKKPKTPPVMFETEGFHIHQPPGSGPLHEAFPDRKPGILLQPETRPISQEQLVNEVKGIYAGLVMMEKKCVEIDQQQGMTSNKLSNEQWQALIALHRTLLHEHHDFFLASQHPSASPALRRLASKYAMPARMWRHGIHSFLELLRDRLPDSLDHMLAFIYLAYSMMALLMESVPAFEDTWIECLGDLARYRMAIEEADLRDREVWSGVARYWYNKAADKSPKVGRIQHHLAVLARPNILRQQFFYTKSLICVQSFQNARESILLLFNPWLEGSESANQRYLPVDIAFIKAQGTLFTQGSIAMFVRFVDDFLSYLDNHIGRITAQWREQGLYIASTNFAALFEFGHPDAVFTQLYSNPLVPLEDLARIQAVREFWSSPKADKTAHLPLESSQDSSMEDAKFSSSLEMITHASHLAFSTFALVLQRIGDKNVLPHVHVSLAFLWSLCFVPSAMTYVQTDVPWSRTALFLNTLGKQGVVQSRIESDEFPHPDSSAGHHLPEDFLTRGQIWSQQYHPVTFFNNSTEDDEERSLEVPSMSASRVERCLWLGIRLASLGRWLLYDAVTKQFSVTSLARELENASKADVMDRRSRTLSLERDDDVKMVDVDPES